MRVIAHLAALLLIGGSVLLFFGGLGPVMMIAAIFDQSAVPVLAQWAIAATFLGVWWGGIGCCVFSFRGLIHSIESSDARPWRVGDWLVLFGHIVALAALVGVVLGFLNLCLDAPVYLLLMVAACFYALGLGALALTGRIWTPPAREGTDR
jgi:hypothetical protein